MNKLSLVSLVGLLGLALTFLPNIFAQDADLTPLKPIERKLPGAGKPLAPEVRKSLEDELKALQEPWKSVANHPLAADAGVMIKAVRLALEFDEFYKPEDSQKAKRLLKEAARRIAALQSNKADWVEQKGLVPRGFRSAVDGSFQPYGMVIPEAMRLGAKAPKIPAIVWLHGRGDNETDLHFLDGRAKSVGQIAVKDIPVIHVFGRQCIGFKSTGETDVIEALEHALAHYPIDRSRVILMGFSMGGAGAWHLGAHYVDRWVAVSPGAGFAETSRYQNLKPEQFPPSFEQTLWRVYDVPNYVRNLFNVPVIAYSGEIDKQMQAALVMEQAFKDEGKTLDHRIGPGMGHKYHPEVLEKMLQDLQQVAKRGRDPKAPLSLQTSTLRYGAVGWVKLERLKEHWQDTRVDATLDGQSVWQIQTKNVQRMRLDPPQQAQPRKVVMDGQPMTFPASGAVMVELSPKQQWALVDDKGSPGNQNLVKSPGLQGPIDDAFLESFVVVTPSGRSFSPALDRWVKFELQHLRDRWRSVFRADLPEVRDRDVNESMLKAKHLVLFGDPQSNAVFKQIQERSEGTRWPLAWSAPNLKLAGHELNGVDHVPVMIYPNPLAPQHYVVLNSGPTFRESHDRTNSLQNPKLPDWALISLEQPPDGERAGRIVHAGFFGEDWQPKPQ